MTLLYPHQQGDYTKNVSFVSSKLDYCNSLLYNLPDSSINRLQRVQNSLARVVILSCKRSDHITPILAKLHWLPERKGLSSKLLL